MSEEIRFARRSEWTTTTSLFAAVHLISDIRPQSAPHGLWA
jgi:hypothetical protein